MEEFKSWEEMSDLEQAQCMYWDMYKDAYGIRPRGVDTTGWTLEDFQTEFAILGEVIDREEKERRSAEQSSAQRFERRVAELIEGGARTRETAIRWIHDAEDTQGDDEYLCYTLGLPYGYFRKVA